VQVHVNGNSVCYLTVGFVLYCILAINFKGENIFIIIIYIEKSHVSTNILKTAMRKNMFRYKNFLWNAESSKVFPLESLW